MDLSAAICSGLPDLAQFALTATLFLFCLTVIYGAIADVTTYTIPNWTSYGLALLFAVYALFAWDRTPVLLHVLLGLLVFTICIVFWKLRWLGGGDVKFVGAIALWMGPTMILSFTLLLALLSTGFVLILQFARKWNPYFQGSKWPWVVRNMVQKAKDDAVPYGLPAAMSALIILFLT